MNEQTTPTEEATKPTTLSQRAEDIRERNAAISDMPVLTRMSESAKLADDVIELVADMAAVIDHNTPYLDEKIAISAD